jgi:O-antigen/teichoic acid export membrane protein
MNVGLTLWLVVGCGMAWMGRIEAHLFTMIVFGCFGLYLLYRSGWLKFTFSKEYIRNALNFGVPLIPHALGGAIMTMTDRFFITNMVGIGETGIYSVGYQIGMIIGLIENSFNQAYVPWLYNKLKENDTKMKMFIVKITYIYFILMIFLVITLALIAPCLLRYFVGDKFSGASVYVFWIALGYAFNGMYKMVVNYIFYVEKTYILAWITLFCCLSNVGLNYILIKLNGPVGAAQAAALTFLLSFIVTWVLSNRVYKMPWLNRGIGMI